MLSRVELHVVEKFAFLATLTFSLPLDWDKDSKLLIPTKSKLKQSLVGINLILVVAYQGFQLVQLLPAFGFYKDVEQKDNLIFHVYFILIQSFLVAVQWHGSMHAINWCSWFNQIRRFNRTSGQTQKKLHLFVFYMPAVRCISNIIGMLLLGKEFSEPNIREKILLGVQWSLYSLAVLFPLIFPLKSNNPNFVYSAIPETWKSSTLFLVFCIFETSNLIRVCILHLSLAVFVFTHIFTLHFWLNRAK